MTISGTTSGATTGATAEGSAGGQVFSRAEGVTWRDTGRRVVALHPDGTDVRVLGGGAAAVWRALDLPTTSGAIAMRLQENEGEAPHHEVAMCLEEMVKIGLLRESS